MQADEKGPHHGIQEVVWFIHLFFLHQPILCRDIQVAYLIVDEMHAEHPELVRDQYWEEGVHILVTVNIPHLGFRE